MDSNRIKPDVMLNFSKQLLPPFLILITVFNGCSKKTQLSVINCNSSYKEFYNNGLSKVASSSDLKIFYYKKYIMYEVPEITVEIFETNKENETIINKVKPVDTTYFYFVTGISQKNGLKYNKLGDKKGEVFSKDSLLRAISLSPLNLEAYAEALGKPSKIERKNNTLFEAYFFKVDDGTPDTILRFYDKKFRHIPFSFSASLDLEKQNKLVKTVFIYKDENKSRKMIKTEVSKSINLVQLKDENPFVEMFNQFEKDREKLNLK